MKLEKSGKNTQTRAFNHNNNQQRKDIVSYPQQQKIT